MFNLGQHRIPIYHMKKEGGSHLRRDGEELSEINLLDVRWSLFIVACSEKHKDAFLDQTEAQTTLRQITESVCVCVCEPLRSRSARMFMGAELSTHTISFRESAQCEWDALQEKPGSESLYFYM